VTLTNQTRAASPETILEVATGYMAAKQLFAASRIGLFQALDAGPLDVAGLASEIGASRRMTRILADSMNSLGLLEREDGTYRLTADARAYLVGSSSEVDLAPFLGFLNNISQPHWTDYFDGTVDTTEPGDLDLSDERLPVFMGGVMTYNALHATQLAQVFDFTGYRDMLDFGGLSSAFAIEAMKTAPELKTTFVFDQAMIESVTDNIAASGLGGRSRVIGAPTATAVPEGGHDLVMVNHVIHRFDAAQNESILRRARGAAFDGARLILLDFFLDDDDRQRALDALHAAEYLVIDGTTVYPEAEVREWMRRAGWRPLETLALPGSPRIIVAEAV
jgi:Dimerisation domain/O-methyltransferase domain